MENKISYILSENEVKQALFSAGVLKPYKKKFIVILIITVILFLTIFRPTDASTYYSALLIFMDLFVYFGYKKNEENIVRRSTTGEVTVLTAFDKYINVVVEAYDADWNIEKQDFANIIENEEEIIICLIDGRLMAIPKRVLTPENKESFEKVFNYFNDLNDKEIVEKIGE